MFKTLKMIYKVIAALLTIYEVTYEAVIFIGWLVCKDDPLFKGVNYMTFRRELKES